MTNKDFWQSISTIINNGFDKDGIIKLEDYAEQFFNKQLLFKRYSPSEQHGCATGGSFHVVASILAGAQQINSLRQKAASKEIVNEQRRKQQL